MENYRRIKVIGRGGFGAVYLCERVSDYSQLVIKEIPVDQMSHEDRQTSLNEAKVQSMLHHPNIVAYYDSFLDEKHMCIVMEYVEGGTLYDYIQSREGLLFDEKMVLRFLAQLLMALHHVHSQSILHRDVKSPNILLNPSKCLLKISDFGISKILTTKTKAMTVLGTPHYISPELCENKPYGQESDVWALGCVLYELLTLHRPFEGDNLPALVMKIMKGDYEPVHEDYSEDIKQLLSSMLQKHPSRRPSISQIMTQPFLTTSLSYIVAEQGSIPHSSFRDPASASVSDESHLSTPTYGASGDSSLVITGKPFKVWFMESTSQLPESFGISLTSYSHNVAKIVLNIAELELQMSSYNSSIPIIDILQSIFRESSNYDKKFSMKNYSDFCTGSGFAVSLSRNHVVSTMGKVATGCLGYNTVLDVSKPQIVKALFGHNIVSISSGSRHAMAVSESSDIFAWGSSEKGCLGLCEPWFVTIPMIVPFRKRTSISQVVCGQDCSFIITDEKSVLACGSNTHNKLGMDTENGRSIDEVKIFDLVRSAPLPKLRVMQVACGISHTAFLIEYGKVCTFGSNRCGQLGWGTDSKLSYNMPGLIDIDSSVTMLACGDFFTMVLTSDYKCFLWGMGPKSIHLEDFREFVNISNLPFLKRDRIMQIAAHGRNIVIITDSSH